MSSFSRRGLLALVSAGLAVVLGACGSNSALNLSGASTSSLTTSSTLGAIEARVVNGSFQPFANQQVLLSGTASSLVGRQAATTSLSLTTDATGNVRAGSLPPGNYSIIAGSATFTMPVSANQITTRLLNTASPATVRTDLGLLYVVNNLGNTLSLIDEGLGTITNNIFATGNAPNQVAFNNGLGYIVNSLDNNVECFDPRTLTKLSLTSTGTGSDPYAIVFLNNTTAYVSNDTANTVSVLNLSGTTPVVTATIPVDNEPEGMCLAGTKLYVCCSNYTVNGNNVTYGQGLVDVIDTGSNTVTAHLQTGIGSNPQDAAVGADGAVYVALTGNYSTVGSSVLRVSGLSPTGSLTLIVPKTGLVQVGGIAVATNGRGFLNDAGNNVIHVIDTKADQVLLSGASALSEGNNPLGIVATPDGAVWVFDFTDGTAQSFDATSYATKFSQVNTGQGPFGGGVRAKTRRPAAFCAAR
jgi:YVTN family beta-propeller protein